ncbi:DNA polymerase V [Dysgonomonas sp. PFB1-18]|uniref:Y-family DNA polymerase n=1 Tax=unclassified Dysgonomonas TaxID=2630389 RepID=UPI0024766DCF|nr:MULTISPECIES: Y-family DNA polymerase [unclassified Dysgonomonas]MDH6311217.1 DNA polymerase V [Dysgonomonas sp. PF1-14]MDH6341091.1 DNA polymerase V [Dysgonomonas sp. PF1-16]MDH6382527.1 DNA polymerase V [Dysgonomonas sp. PFB1-18]MDH6399939.1 DNA polymerase V [Dysgonomonas sp. PF1-23]
MFCLVDCNSFFVACEQLINPRLMGKPVVVLSSNDGIIVSLSAQAKAVGLKRGDAKFKIQDIIERHNVHCLSGNHDLYDDISDRVMIEIGKLVPHISVYSCDECFANLSGIPDIQQKAFQIRETLLRNVGIPVSIGVASTKALCKVANKFAKKHSGYQGVCMIDTEEKRIKALQKTDVGDIWGIGRSYSEILNSHAVNTAYEFTLKPRAWVRKYLSVVGERLWCELQGEPCIITDMPEVKKQILNSRTFGHPITGFDELLSALVYFADLGMKKVRKQKSLTRGLGMFISTSRFSDPDLRYYASRYIKLPYATLDTGEVSGYIRILLNDIFKSGYAYSQAGIVYSDFQPQDNCQLHLLDNKDRVKQLRLAKAIDAIEDRFGSGTIKPAIIDCGKNGNWRPKAQFLSPGSTRLLENAIKVNVGNKNVYL